MLDLLTLLGALGVETEVLKARETATGQARGNIFNQNANSEVLETEVDKECGIHKLILNLLSALPETLTLAVPQPAKSA